jgi:hypothetical protein
MDRLTDYNSGSSLGGQQNYHSHSRENGTTDSYESISMSRNSHGGAVSGMDAQSFHLDATASWSAQDSQLETLERWFSQSSRESIGSPQNSFRTVTPEHSIKAQSVELLPSLSQMSHRSGNTDRSFSLPDNGLYPSSLDFSDNRIYSELKCIDDMDSSVGHGSYNEDAKSSSRRPSHLMLVSSGSSYPTHSSPAEVMFASPMELMSQAMFEPVITHGVSAPMDPLNIGDSLWATWDSNDQPDSGESTPYSADMAWSAGPTTKNSMTYSPTRATNPPRYVAIPPMDPNLPHTNSLARASRKAMGQQNGRANGDHSANYQSGFYDGMHRSDRSHSRGSDNDSTPRDHELYQKATIGADGLYHCPWEGKDTSCSHKPEKLKCNYE